MLLYTFSISIIDYVYTYFSDGLKLNKYSCSFAGHVGPGFSLSNSHYTFLWHLDLHWFTNENKSQMTSFTSGEVALTLANRRPGASTRLSSFFATSKNQIHSVITSLHHTDTQILCFLNESWWHFYIKLSEHITLGSGNHLTIFNTVRNYRELFNNYSSEQIVNRKNTF